MSQQGPRTFLRFLIAGAFNTLFGWAVYSCSIWAGAEPWLALIIGTLTGIAFNFLSVGGYAFRDMGWDRLPRFIMCYVVVYAVNLICITILHRWILNSILAQAVLTPPMAIFSYLLLSRIVFRPPSGRRALHNSSN